MGAMGAVMGGGRKTEGEAMVGRRIDGKRVAVFVLIKPPGSCGQVLHQAMLRLGPLHVYMDVRGPHDRLIDIKMPMVEDKER
jgi:hypothetical protein